MSLPEKLLEKAFYWGPLFVGIVSLIVGVVFVRAVTDVDGEIPLAKLQLNGSEISVANIQNKSPSKIALKVKKPNYLQQEHSQKQKEDDLSIQTQKSKQSALSSAITQKNQKQDIATKDTQKTFVEKKAREAQIVRVTIPQLVSLHSAQIGANAPLAISGLRETTFHPLRIGFRHTGSELAYWGKLSQFGLKKSVGRGGYISVMAQAEVLGNRGQDFIEGLTTIKARAIRPLIVHYSEKIGQDFLASYDGLERSGENGSLIQTMFLSGQGEELGALSANTSSGLSLTTTGSEKLFKKFKITKFSQNLGEEISLKNLKGVNRAVVHAEQMKIATLALAGSGKLSLNEKNTRLDKSNLACSSRFYAALQELRSTKISSIRSVARPISKIDKTLPGKWIFSPPAFKTRSICKKYKYRKSRKRRCVKWGKSVATNTSYTSEEKDYILAAQKFITGRGRHPMVKPRSPSHWVINIVAQNLNSYSSQKTHPALCTGALGMVDYFEGNLTRFKKHMTSILTLNEQSKTHILNQVSRLNASIKSQSSVETISAEIDSVTQNQKIHISSYDPLTVNGQAVAALFGEDVGLEILSRDEFIDALKLTRTLITSRKPHIHASTYAQFIRLATILEASYYIQKSHDKYKMLEQKLFGSLRGIRTAHTSHCNCSK